MKQKASKLIYKLFLLTLVVSFFPVQKTYSQCNTKTNINKLISGLPKKPRYTYLKGYNIEASRARKDKKTGQNYMEYSYIFSSGTKYLVALDHANVLKKNDVKIEIYNSSHKEIINNEVDGKKYRGVAYTCEKTGKYYIRFIFTGKTKCAGGILSFTR